MQEAFLRAVRHFDPPAIVDPRAWLLTIVRNCCYTAATRRRGDASRTEQYDEELHGRTDGSPNAEALAVAGAERDELRAVLDALPPDHREMLVLREIQGLSYKEISRIVGVPIGTVMSRLARARERLRGAVGGRAREGG